MIGAWLQRRREERALRAAAAKAREAAEDAVNPRCVCGHRSNVHARLGPCIGWKADGRPGLCPCMGFIQAPREDT